MPVEVGEEEEEHGPVEEDDVAEDLWEVALDEEGEGGVHKEGYKLAKLHGGEVPATILKCFGGETDFHSVALQFEYKKMCTE